jgi:hypothetical protein
MTVDESLKQEFPALQIFGFQITSPRTRQYNCIAWAAGRNDKWWWPVNAYWPGHARHDESLRTFVAAFSKLGYAPCNSDSLEVGHEKVAIYVGSNGLVTHMARQLPDGRWTSKLGEGVDIAHVLEGICGNRYGSVGKILKRKTR